MKVFISYAGEDIKIAEKLYEDLQRNGITPWMEEKDLLPGQGRINGIKQAIGESLYFLTLISAKSVSKQGFVQTEQRIALELLDELPPDSIFIIPVSVDGSRSAFERMRELEPVDISESYDKGLDRILQSIFSESGRKKQSDNPLKAQNNIRFWKREEAPSQGLSSGFMRLMTLLTIALTSIGLTIILFGYFSDETKIRTDFVRIIVAIVIASAICMGFILILSKAYRDISIRSLIFILIPLCMTASVSSAAYLLDENVLHIIGRMVSPSDEKKPEEVTPQHNSGTGSKIPDIGKSDPPKTDQSKPGNDRENEVRKREDKIVEEPVTTPKPFTHNDSTSRTSRRVRNSYLRSEPITVSGEEAKSRFGLDERWRPLEYIQNDFKDNGDGTITDNATGLMWQKSGSPNWVYLKDVPAYIEKLNREKFAGYSDWRLPTVDELKSLITQEKQSNGRNINPIFDSKQWWYWTSDKYASGGAWSVYFDYGDVNWDDDLSDYVRAVRLRQ